MADDPPSSSGLPHCLMRPLCDCMQCAKPENVVVELCRSRTGVMYESDSASEPSTSGRDEAAGLQISRCGAAR